MKRFLALAAVITLTITLGAVFADHHGENSAFSVGSGHQLLLHEVGTWDAEQRLWADPNSSPTITKGVETNEMLGQFWVVGKFESEMFGQPFFGRSQVGYDSTKKKFIGTWIDSTSPMLNRIEGTLKGNTLTMYSKTVDPATGDEMTTKMVSTYPDEDHKTFAAYESVSGAKDQWRKTMEVMYTKRK